MSSNRYIVGHMNSRFAVFVPPPINRAVYIGFGRPSNDTGGIVVGVKLWWLCAIWILKYPLEP